MDTNGLKAAIQLYFDACYEDDEEKMREVFHSAAHVYGHIDGGAFKDSDLETFIKVATKPPGAPRPDHPRKDEIISIDFTGENTAVARVSLRTDVKFYTDILSFIRLDGKWTIISKLFSGVPI